ncbi:multidrug effflux MFS transporter [Mongoliimonas terrestris]|uniref:multidrug effflux MFS transporter n=1 Tax=Mongoliimonas terrestris TaxID=1709001 RepID=UPI0009495B0D|nr:multidrug effflux MFS transporter [Mongoliimonas terrestris]
MADRPEPALAVDGAALPPSRRPHILLLVAMAAVNAVAINIYMPSMPRLAEAFDTTYAKVQLTLSLYLLATGLAQVIVGPLSDRYGRRPVAIGGFALFTVGSALALVAPSIEVMIAARILQGAGGCTGMALSRAIVRDIYDRDRAASMIGYVTMGMSVAPMVAPLIGGVLQEVADWWASFAVLVVFGAGILVATILGLHETNPNVGRTITARELVAQWGALGRSRLFWGYVCVSTFASAVYFAFLGGAPYVVSVLMHVSPAMYGVYFLTVSGGYLVGNFLSGRYAARYGVALFITGGNLLQLLSVLAMALLFAAGIMHPMALFGPMVGIAVANGITLPSAIAGAVSVRPDLAGAASGLAGSFQMGVGAGASALAGALLITVWTGTPFAMVVIMAVAAVLSLLAGIAVRRAG